MALEWENLVDGKSEIVADDINKLAKAIKDNEKAIENSNDLIENNTKNLEQEIEETNQSIIDVSTNLQKSIEETNQSIIDVSTNLQKSIDDTKQSLEYDIEEKTIINDATNTSIRLNDSSNNNFRDIDITDTTNNEVTIDVYGKNLYGYIKPNIANGTVIEELENGAVVQGNQADETTGADNSARGSFNSGYTSSSAICPRVFEGQTITLSADVTLLEAGNSSSPNKFSTYVYTRTGSYVSGKSFTLDLNVKQRIVHTFTIKEQHSGKIIYPVFRLNSNKLRIENIQFAFGDDEIELGEFRDKQSITLSLPLTDEGKEQFKTLHSNKPVTTILNDKNIEMTVDYEADIKAYIDNKFNELNNAILSIGGNV
jgi:hypothetical protein